MVQRVQYTGMKWGACLPQNLGLGDHGSLPSPRNAYEGHQEFGFANINIELFTLNNLYTNSSSSFKVYFF